MKTLKYIVIVIVVVGLLLAAQFVLRIPILSGLLEFLLTPLQPGGLESMGRSFVGTVTTFQGLIDQMWSLLLGRVVVVVLAYYALSYIGKKMLPRVARDAKTAEQYVTTERKLALRAVDVVAIYAALRITGDFEGVVTILLIVVVVFVIFQKIGDAFSKANDKMLGNGLIGQGVDALITFLYKAIRFGSVLVFLIPVVPLLTPFVTMIPFVGERIAAAGTSVSSVLGNPILLLLAAWLNASRILSDP